MPYQDLAPDAGPEDIQQKGADAPSENLPAEGQYWLDEYETITYLTYDEFVADIVSVAKPITENTMPTLVRVVNGEPFYTMKNRFFIAYASINGNVIRTLYEYNAEIVENSDRSKIFQPPGSVKCGEYKGLPIFEANPDVSNEPPGESSSVTMNEAGTTTKTTQNTKPEKQQQLQKQLVKLKINHRMQVQQLLVLKQLLLLLLLNLLQQDLRGQYIITKY